jgi:hypothetical protein
VFAMVRYQGMLNKAAYKQMQDVFAVVRDQGMIDKSA